MFFCDWLSHSGHWHNICKISGKIYFTHEVLIIAQLKQCRKGCFYNFCYLFRYIIHSLISLNSRRHSLLLRAFSVIKFVFRSNKWSMATLCILDSSLVSPWIFIVLFSNLLVFSLIEKEKKRLWLARTLKLVDFIFSRQTGFSTSSVLVLI